MSQTYTFLSFTGNLTFSMFRLHCSCSMMILLLICQSLWIVFFLWWLIILTSKAGSVRRTGLDWPCGNKNKRIQRSIEIRRLHCRLLILCYWFIFFGFLLQFFIKLQISLPFIACDHLLSIYLYLPIQFIYFCQKQYCINCTYL